MQSSRLRVSVEGSGAASVLRVTGDIDIITVAAWRNVVTQVVDAVAAPGVVVIEFDRASFLGLCAFTTLIEAAERCCRRGIELRLVGVPPSVSRISALRLWGTEWSVYPSVAAATVI